MGQAARANRKGGNPAMWVTLAFAGALMLAVVCIAMMLRAPSPTEHAYGATLYVLAGYGIFHAVLGMLMTAFLRARILHGFTSATRRAEFPIVALWVNYASVIGVLVLLAAHLRGLLS